MNGVVEPEAARMSTKDAEGLKQKSQDLLTVRFSGIGTLVFKTKAHHTVETPTGHEYSGREHLGPLCETEGIGEDWEGAETRGRPPSLFGNVQAPYSSAPSLPLRLC